MRSMDCYCDNRIFSGMTDTERLALIGKLTYEHHLYNAEFIATNGLSGILTLDVAENIGVIDPVNSKDIALCTSFEDLSKACMCYWHVHNHEGEVRATLMWAHGRYIKARGSTVQAVLILIRDSMVEEISKKEEALS